MSFYHQDERDAAADMGGALLLAALVLAALVIIVCTF